MAQNEAARQTGEPIVVSDSPDVCITSGSPVPYPIVAYLPSCVQLANSVLFTEDPAFTTVSSIPGVIGDEAGAGKGVVSGSHAGSGYTHVVAGSHTPNVFAEENLIVFHLSKMEMNAASPLGTGNTIGTLLWQSVVRGVWPNEDGSLEGETDPEDTPESEAELDHRLGEENPQPQSEWEVAGKAEQKSMPMPWEQPASAKVEIEHKTTHYENQLAGIGDEDDFVRVGHTEVTSTFSASTDGSSAEIAGGAKASFEGVSAQTTFGNEDANVKVAVEALSAEAAASVSASVGPDGVAVKGEAGVEAVLAKASAEGSVKITAQDVLDETVNSWLSWADVRLELPEAIGESGVVVTGGAEGMIGAAAKAEGELRVDEKGIKIGGKLGAALGIGGGLKGSIALVPGDGLVDGVMSAVDGAKSWFRRTFGGGG